MANLDRFIEVVYRTGADRLVLCADEKIQIATGSERRAVTAQPTTLPQVLQLLREIAPPDLSETMSQADSCDFAYDAPVGPVRVHVQRDNGSLQVELERDAGAAAGPAAKPTGAPRLEQLFRQMVQENCSDLHLCSACPPLFRKDGEIVNLGQTAALAPEMVRDLLLEITPEINRAQFESRHDTDFSYEIAGVARFRCNLFMDRKGMGGVFRVIPAKIPSAKALGLSAAMLELCNLHKGLVLVTGPTGSGKSTTLAAMIDTINQTRAAHIITVEDPIEFVHENRTCLVNQREVGGHTNGFKSALRAALREDPDIVLVGEMRDLETMEIAIETAETGHLVFGTLHTNTAASTVDRIIDQFPGDRQNQVRSMLADSLKGVVAQTLCKRKGGGLVAAHEVLLVNAAVSNLIREGKTFQIPTIMQTGKASGMSTLNDSLLELVKQGTVEPNQAYAKAVARSEFRALLERNHLRIDGA